MTKVQAKAHEGAGYPHVASTIGGTHDFSWDTHGLLSRHALRQVTVRRLALASICADAVLARFARLAPEERVGVRRATAICRPARRRR